MYRQQQAPNVPGGRGYATEVAGRDRAKFFRRPVEPDNTVLDDAHNAAARAEAAQAVFATSYPSFSMPSNAAGFAASAPHGGAAVRARGGGQRPTSALGWHPRRSNSPGGLLRKRGAAARRARPHHLPSLEGRGGSGTGDEGEHGGRVAASVQTMYRENEAQTDPYSPDYVIPDGAPTPEILGLQSLTYRNGGLPAGREGVELIQRLRRRRDVEAALPTGTDAASVEARYTVLHELEEKEWAEREDYTSQLQQRRLERLKESLLVREAAREDANRERLEQIKSQYLTSLGGKLTSLEKRRVALSKRGIDRMARLQAEGGAGGHDSGQLLEGGGGTTSAMGGSQGAAATSVKGGRTKPSIATYARYGTDGAPPQIAQGGAAGGPSMDARLRAARQAFNYDVRPQLLADPAGTEVVDAERGARVDRVAPRTFVVPENEAVQRLPTLYQRREAERVLHSLEYAYSKLHPSEESDTGKVREMSAQRVLDLYRATPKLQRPETPVLELDGDDEEEEEDACILLQRLLRGRAVQNDFFDGRERCRGLIEELQAASTAQTAEQRAAAQRKEEMLAAEREAEAQHVVGSALGAIIHDTLGFLSQELGRQQDMAALRRLQEEAEAVRATREAAERARRAEVRQQRDRNEVAYAAYMRATDTTLQCFLEDVTLSAVAETAMAVAVGAEKARQAERPAPQHSTTEAEAEDVVCDMLDGFVIPAIVDAIALQDRELEKKAVAGAALDAAHTLSGTGGRPHAP
ncbi:Solute carrier (proton/amino acid symporter), TRAMD3 or PAT1 [Novymonas esmeraldas]|uniref:Cilia- and flagella-associated protein 91 n=1 Tax=Novymonas esmeraldas TaxID=1808958 RepID=A0AAW0F9R7_9TRYP